MAFDWPLGPRQGRAIALGIALATWVSVLMAQADVVIQTSPDGLERQRIAQERSDLQRRFAQDEQACRTAIFEKACLAQLLPQQRSQMAALKRQEQLLDAAERQRRAGEQLQKSEQKRAARQALLASEAPAESAESRRDAAAAKAVQAAERDEQATQARRKADARLEQSQARAQQQTERDAAADAQAGKFKKRLEQAAQRQHAHDQRQTEAGAAAVVPLPTPRSVPVTP